MVLISLEIALPVKKAFLLFWAVTCCTKTNFGPSMRRQFCLPDLEHSFLFSQLEPKFKISLGTRPQDPAKRISQMYAGNIRILRERAILLRLNFYRNISFLTLPKVFVKKGQLANFKIYEETTKFY